MFDCVCDLQRHSRFPAIPSQHEEQHDSASRCRSWSGRTRRSRCWARRNSRWRGRAGLELYKKFSLHFSLYLCLLKFFIAVDNAALTFRFSRLPSILFTSRSIDRKKFSVPDKQWSVTANCFYMIFGLSELLRFKSSLEYNWDLILMA